MGGKQGEVDIFSMSDEEIMNMSAPPVVQTEQKTEEQQVEKPPVEQEEVKTEADLEIERQQAADPSLVLKDEEQEGNKDQKTEGEEDPTKKIEDAQNKDKNLDLKAEPDKKTDQVVQEAPVDKSAAYDLIMTPFKANGRTVELKSPEEAIKLMQMGANYTRQMQALAPSKKILSMLEKNNLLDESKLSFLIDLDKKNPDAIKELVKNSGIDPLDINTDDKTAYRPSNHSVTDAEVTFDSTLDEVSSTPTGPETLTVINTTWDQASKEALWASPQIMTIINEQRASGVYDQITSEIERRRTFGSLSASTPFLEAYKDIGAELHASGKLSVKTEQKRTAPIDTRAATVKSDTLNDDKARAAAAPKAAQAKKDTIVNPLAMSDDDFLKSMSNRL